MHQKCKIASTDRNLHHFKVTRQLFLIFIIQLFISHAVSDRSIDFELQETFSEVSIDWKIKDFFSLGKEPDNYVESPTFSLSGGKWAISMYPDGRTKDDSTGSVSLFLNRKCSSSKNYSVAFSLGIRKADGSKYSIVQTEYEFPNNTGYGWPKYIKASVLRDSRGVVSKEGSLTVFCKAKVTTPRIIDENVADNTFQTLSMESVQILQQNFKNLYLNGSQVDVTIMVKDREFQAHSVILSARSPIFFRMFDNDSEEMRPAIVNITDCDPESFEVFLHFMYTGELDVVSSSNAVGLYKTAEKYELHDLKNECVRCMANNLSVESFREILLLASKHNESTLLDSATDFFAENIKAILLTSDWQSLGEEHFAIANEILIKMANEKF